MISAKLRELKEKSHMTTQQIAEASGVPASTVSRLMSGQTDNPSFQNVADVVRAMGGSMDEIIGLVPQVSRTAPQEEHRSTPVVHDCLHGERQHCCAIVTLYERSIEYKNRWIKNLFILCGSLIGAFILVLLIDILNGNFGFIQY